MYSPGWHGSLVSTNSSSILQRNLIAFHVMISQKALIANGSTEVAGRQDFDQAKAVHS
jgi:hypothetical protein